MALWQLDQTMGGSDIKVTRKELLKTMSDIYVPYLKGPNVDDFNVEQVSSGRLDVALRFLEDIDFIRIKKAERGKEGDDLIITSRNKAPQVNNFIKYFIRRQSNDSKNLRRKDERAGRTEEGGKGRERKTSERC
jgi:hypothetical protein